MSGLAGIQANVARALSGTASIPGIGSVAAPASALTTTAVNLTIVVNGKPQGLIKTMSIDEQFNYQRVKAIGSAIDIAMLPGVYEATGTIDTAFLFGVTIEQAFGGGIRPVVGRYLSDPDFTKFYFNIVETNANGSIVAVRHDCVLTSVRRTYEIDQVTIMQNAGFMARWSESV